jgi:hypothetical protein
MSRHASLTDKQTLEALDLRDNEGWTMTQIGTRFGKSKSAIIGLLSRINKDTDKSDPDNIHNGTMPRKWWKK